MSTTFNPNGTIPQATSPAPVAIASSTNASPIAITTSTPHGYTTGDTVQVTGHQTNTAANGLWVITVTGASAFTLAGSTGVAVGGATGQVQDHSVNPLLTLPADSDMRYASSVNVPISGQANVAPFLYQRVGAYNLHAIYRAGTFTSQTNTFSSTALSTGVWVELTNLTNILSASADRYLIAGDILEVDFSTTILMTRGGAVVRYALGVGIVLNGGAVAAQSNSARVVQLDNAISTVDYLPASTSVVIDSGFSADDRFDISIVANKDSAAAYTLDLQAGYQLTVRHWRSNA